MTPMTPSVDDVITTEVIRGALLVAAEEASIVVVRAAHSTFIQEGADACAAILDADAQLVALSTATSLMHAASLRCSLPALIEDVPLAAGVASAVGLVGVDLHVELVQTRVVDLADADPAELEAAFAEVDAYGTVVLTLS